MALINASIISFSLMAYNAGFPDDFLNRWAMNFIIAFTIVVPSIIFVGSHISKLIEKILRKN
jgi:hypothetical protein